MSDCLYLVLAGKLVYTRLGGACWLLLLEKGLGERGDTEVHSKYVDFKNTSISSKEQTWA